MKNILAAMLAVATLSSLAAADGRENGIRAVRLKDAYRGKFLIGTCLNSEQLFRIDSAQDRIISGTYNCVTAENLMKPVHIQPQEGKWDFSGADACVEFAEKRKMAVIGHCLVWHSQAAEWMFAGPDGKPAGRELLIERMRTHIATTVGRYRGRIKGWDVVNEAIEWDGALRKSKWLEIIGEDFIDLAFKFAQEADPGAELYYNDYGLDGRAKADGVVRLVERLKAKGIRIDAVGMQSHQSLAGPDLGEYEKSIRSFIAAGVKVAVTELDVSVLPSAWGLSAEISTRHDYDEKYNPYRDGLPKEKEREQAERYAKLFAIYLRHAEHIDRVTFWGTHDRMSWLNDFPVAGRTDYPLLYDRKLRAKQCALALERLARRKKSPSAGGNPKQGNGCAGGKKIK